MIIGALESCDIIVFDTVRFSSARVYFAEERAQNVSGPLCKINNTSGNRCIVIVINAKVHGLRVSIVTYTRASTYARDGSKESDGMRIFFFSRTLKGETKRITRGTKDPIKRYLYVGERVAGTYR